MGSSDGRILLRIGGMTCVNCQNKIETALNRTYGVVKARVSYSKGTAEIIYDKNKISPKSIISAIERLEYKVLPGDRHSGPGLRKLICMLTIIVALYAMLQSMGILNRLAPSQLADTQMGYGMLFVIGLITSVHCIAMCGGINISQCIPQGELKENGGKLAAFRPALAYNMGRVLSYTAVGFGLGLVGLLVGGGAEVGVPVFLQGILKMAAGLLMVLMGINMLGLFPWLRRFTIRVPGFLARRLGKERAGSSRPFVVGILNGFMPCGPLQSMWIVALATGNPLAGALSMFLFSLGTVPLMLGLGSVVSAFGKKFTDQVMTVGAVLVVVLGLAMLSQGGALSGWLPPDLLFVLVIALCTAGVLLSIPIEKKGFQTVLRATALAIVAGSYALWSFWGSPVQGTDAEVDLVDGVQVVNSTLSPGRYPDITVQAGVPVQWVIDAPEGSINGCNYKIRIQDYDIEYVFHTGENVIEFTPAKTGTVRYSCWMGMIHGNIFVTDEREDGAAAPNEEISVPIPAGYTLPTEQIAVASVTADESGDGIQEVSIALTEEGFSPAILVVQNDLPAVWRLDNQLAEAGNGTDLLAPHWQWTLGEGENRLRLHPTESFVVSTGDHRFYCYIKTVEDLDAVDEETIRTEAAAFVPLIDPTAAFESAGMSCCG